LLARCRPPTRCGFPSENRARSAISTGAGHRLHDAAQMYPPTAKAPPLTTSLHRLRSSSAVAAGVTHVAGYGHCQLPNDKREQTGPRDRSGRSQFNAVLLEVIRLHATGGEYIIKLRDVTSQNLKIHV
jgi:hypothetical protein